MTREEIANRAKALEGMGYLDWIKLRIAVDEAFAEEKRKLDLGLQLPSAERITEIIHTQFG